MASGKAAGEGAGGVKGGDEARRLEMLDFGFGMYRAGWEAAHCLEVVQLRSALTTL